MSNKRVKKFKKVQIKNIFVIKFCGGEIANFRTSPFLIKCVGPYIKLRPQQGGVKKARKHGNYVPSRDTSMKIWDRPFFDKNKSFRNLLQPC